MIESCRLPSCSSVASRAGRGESRFGVRRVVGAVVILGVAGVTIRGRALVLAADVAGYTIEGRMRSCQRVSRKLQVVEFRTQPAIRGVTCLAGGRKVQRRVARIGCRLKIFQVTTLTVC
jgi:hypothetical protein